MIVRERVPLAPYTSLGVGGPARFFVEVERPAELAEAYALARKRGMPLRMLGAGTNVLVPDEGVEALVVRLLGDSFEFEGEEEAVTLTTQTLAKWDDLVYAAGERGLWGIENLAAIPGSAGGALVQNIGAYGTELSSVFLGAEAFDLATGSIREITPTEVRLAYRTSLFKERRGLIITAIRLRLSLHGEPNVAYADLVRAREAGTPLTTPVEVAAAIRTIRNAKFPERGCAGSFFKNPVIAPDAFAALSLRYPGLPGYPDILGVKIPLAWLLDRGLGLTGYARGPVRLYERQPLALVAEEGARASDVDALAHDIETRVKDAFGIVIEREVETFA